MPKLPFGVGDLRGIAGMRFLEPGVNICRGIVRSRITEWRLKIQRVMAGCAVVLISDGHHERERGAGADAICALRLAGAGIGNAGVMAGVARKALRQVRFVIELHRAWIGRLERGKFRMVNVEPRDSRLQRRMALGAVRIADMHKLLKLAAMLDVAGSAAA